MRFSLIYICFWILQVVDGNLKKILRDHLMEDLVKSRIYLYKGLLSKASSKERTKKMGFDFIKNKIY